jgi:hypothetical protein
MKEMNRLLITLGGLLVSCGSVLACGCPFVPSFGFSRGPGQDYGFGTKGCEGRVFAWEDTYTNVVNVWVYGGVSLLLVLAAFVLMKRRRSSNQASEVTARKLAGPQG